MDPGTGLTILGSAIGGAKLVEKLLGPTADYVGVGLRNWTEKRIANASKIFEKAAEKLGDKIEQAGSVPPRVLKEILDEGSYCDDELTAEYFGGVLASSRSGISRDDRAAAYLKLTSELSSYQVRFHFIAYTTWRNLFESAKLRPTFGDDLEKMWLFLPYTFLNVAMDFEIAEPQGDILMHCMSGLERHDLMKSSHWGSVDHINKRNKDRGWLEISEPGLCITPTQFGIDLWLWAIGAGTISRTRFLEPNLDLPKLPHIPLPPGPKKLVAASVD